MLVAMAVTLLMMGAVVNLFANVSASVNNNTAKMEQSARLRTARQVLENDLAGATCPPYPWREPGEDVGYFEIVEGVHSESNPSFWVRDLNNDGQLLQNDDVDLANGTTLDPATSILPRNNLVRDYDGNGAVDDSDRQAHFQHPNSLRPGGIGDYDDILSMTVRSEDKPFVGRAIVETPPESGTFNTVTIESDLAEVIWYAVENPPDNSLGEPGMRTIYRRVLLIAPWLPEVDLRGVGYGGLSETLASRPISFFGRFDVSARYVGEPATDGRWVPNTLGDLTKRENRFAHAGSYPPLFIDRNWSATRNYPHAIDESAIRFIINPQDQVAAEDINSISPLRPFAPVPGSGLPDRTGQDVMLGDVLTWDLRVYDPGAPLIPNTAGTAVLEPSDPGWRLLPPNQNPVGYGAFVDLGWNYSGPGVALLTWNPIAGEPRLLFADAHRVAWHPARPTAPGTLGYPAVFDAWSLHYERDNLDQDNDETTSNTPRQIDEGINGFDDDNANGVDDILERETAPPYDTPLRGMQARIRIYERNARSIRSATVTKNFVPE